MYLSEQLLVVRQAKVILGVSTFSQKGHLSRRSRTGKQRSQRPWSLTQQDFFTQEKMLLEAAGEKHYEKQKSPSSTKKNKRQKQGMCNLQSHPQRYR